MPQDRDGATYTHGMADIEAGLRLHDVTAGEGERTVVLLHGFPQTGMISLPLRLKALAVGGAISTSGPVVEEMMREVANHVTGVRVPATAHWIAEENPTAFTVALLEFLN